MNYLAFGKYFAGIFVAAVLFSGVASMPFRAGPLGDSSAFDSFVDAIAGDGVQEAHADDGPGKGKGKKFKVDNSTTPFQKGLKSGIDSRGHQNKPHPHATFEDPEIFQNDTKIIIKGKSKLKFDNPGQAGKGKWDDYIIENDNATNDNVNKFGTVKPGNYNDLVIEKINEKVLQKAKELENSTGGDVAFHHIFKNDDDGDGLTDEDGINGINDDNDCTDSSGNIFRDDGCFDEEGNLRDGMTGLVDEDPVGEFEFGFEKRQVEIEEIYDLTFDNEEDATEVFALIMSDEDPMMAASEIMGLTGTSTVHKKVLMGFTFAPPAIDWTIGTKEEVCIDLLFDEFCFTAFEARAGFFLEYGIGLRLPAEVSLTTVDPMVEDHAYHVSTSLQPLDFSAAEYSAMGVAPFGGNEFAAFLEFFLGVKVVIVEVTVIDWALETDIDLAEMCTEFTHESGALEDVDCGNFVTPFGTDPVTGDQREFPVPAVTLPADKTGLKMSFAGATLGIGLRVDPTFGSGSITADWSATGDASGSGSVGYTNSADNGSIVEFGPVNAANIGPGTDNAEIRLDDFSYHLDTMQITLSANIDLGGWLSFVPDLPFFELITVDLQSLGFPTLSIGQHSGTDGAQKNVFVQHYGIDIEVAPETQDVEPGFFGNYTVSVTNTGNVGDTFDTFAVSGLPGTWENSFESSMVPLNPSESTSFEVGIKPFRHYTTSPGDYHFTVHGASEGAKVHGLVRTDSDSDIVHVLPFFEPHLSISPLHQQVLPGGTADYLIMVENFGNAPDNISLDIALLDFMDKYRAVPTAIQPEWTMIGATEFGPIDPAQNDTTTFTVTVPATWEGMEDATYNFTGTATSETDPDATVSDTAGLGVNATKESMARYVDLEIRWLIEDVEASPIDDELKQDLLDQLLSAEQKKEQGLGYIIDGKFKQANNMLGATENMMHAFVSHVEAQNGKGIPEATALDWIDRGNTIAADLQTVIAQPA